MMFDGEHKVIPIKGIARAGADSLCEDGAMNEVIGLEYKDGSYVPYSGVLSGHGVPNWATNIYIHKTSTQNNIIVKTESELLWMSEERFNTTEDIGDYGEWEVLCNAKVKDVEFIGNIISVSTDKGVEHLIFEPNKKEYEVYQASNYYSKLPRLQFSVSIGDDSNKIKGAFNEGNLLVVKGTSAYKGGDTNVYTIAGQLQTVQRVVDLYGEGERSEIAQLALKAHALLKEKGRITGYVLATYAYRLKTGEYIYASNPVLLGMPKANAEDKYNIYIPEEEIYLTGTDVQYDKYKSENKHYGTAFAWGDKDYTLSNGKIIASDKWGVAGSKLDDRALSLESAEIPSMFAWYHQSYGTGQFGANDDESCFKVAATGNILNCHILSSIPDELKPIIDSCCIFISDTVSPYEFKESSIAAKESMNAGANSYKTCGYKFIKKSEEEILKEIKELRNFYKVYDIPFANMVGGSFVVDLEGKLGDSLFTQDVLPVSAFDHSVVASPMLKSYNYRMHCYGYKQKLSTYVYLEGYRGGKGQYSISDNELYDARICVKIKSNDGYSEVWLDTNSSYAFTNPIIAYPNPNAYRMEIYIDKHNGISKCTFDLTPSPNGGYAYYIGNTKYNVLNANITVEELPEKNNINQEYIRDNYLKVSGTYTPNYFPLDTTYTIGNGSIIGIASLSISLSQDTFGQYPLLVFCTDGIYSMGVDTTGTGVYNNIAPFSREVCINRNTICEIDGAVLFASSKGLMIATAQGVDEFIPTLNGEPKHLPQDDKTTNGLGLALYKEAINHELAVQLTGCISKDDFIDFLSDSKTVVTYASEKNNIVVYNPSKPYCYWIDIPTRNTTKLPVGIRMDNNNYPNEEYVTAENRIMMFKHLSAEGDVQCVLQSRPIKLGGKHTSHIRVVARGYFNSADAGKYAVMLVLGSYDGVNWQPLGSMQKPFAGGFHDLGCVVDRVSCEYMMVVVSGSLSSNSHIDGIELTKENKYINKLK